MKKIFTLCCLFVMVMLYACGDSDDNGSGDLTGSELRLVADKTEITNGEGQEVVFTVLLDGKDITQHASIINQQTHKPLTKRKFSSEATGQFRFMAYYDELESEEVTITVKQQQLFSKNILLMQYTGTGCINCPGFTVKLKDLLTYYPETMIPMAVHVSIPTFDPYEVGIIAGALRKKLGVNEAPSVKIDFSLDIDALAESPDAPSPVGIALNSTLEGRRLTLKAMVKSAKHFDGECKIAVVICENGIHGTQVGQGEKDYVHNWVVRKYLTDVLGDKMGEGVPSPEKDFENTYTYDIPESMVPENMYAVVYVLDPKDVSLNSRKIEFGKSVDFQYELSE